MGERTEVDVESFGRGMENVSAILRREYTKKSGPLLKFLDNLEVTYQADPESNLLYKIIFNIGRTQRLSGGFPTFDESIKAFQEGKENNIINVSPPYYTAINPCPVVHGALTLIKHPHTNLESINKEVTEESLEVMLDISRNTGIRIFHNMDGAGATKIEPHWQGMMHPFQVEFAAREEPRKEANCHIYRMPNYPGENVILSGEKKVRKALELADYLSSRIKSFITMIANDEIYIIPVKNQNAGVLFGLDPRSRLAGFECSDLCYIAVSKKDYKKVRSRGIVKLKDGREPELCVKNIIREGLFQNEILKGANLILKWY